MRFCVPLKRTPQLSHKPFPTADSILSYYLHHIEYDKNSFWKCVDKVYSLWLSRYFLNKTSIFWKKDKTTITLEISLSPYWVSKHFVYQSYPTNNIGLLNYGNGKDSYAVHALYKLLPPAMLETKNFNFFTKIYLRDNVFCHK